MSNDFIPKSTVFSYDEESTENVTVSPLPIADVVIQDGQEESLRLTRNIAVKQMVSRNEVVVIDSEVISRVRNKLVKIKSINNYWDEILICISGAFIGVIASVYFTDTFLSDGKKVLVFSVLPTLTAIFLTIFVLNKKRDEDSAKSLAEQILDDIPNPDDTVEVGFN